MLLLVDEATELLAKISFLSNSPLSLSFYQVESAIFAQNFKIGKKLKVKMVSKYAYFVLVQF